MAENVTVWRPANDGSHKLVKASTLSALIAPTDPSVSPTATGTGLKSGFDVYVQFASNWPDIAVGDTLEVRGERFKLTTTPNQWVDRLGNPVGTVIHVERP